MAFALKAAVLVMLALAAPSKSESMIEYGAKTAVKAYDIVCWYVNLKAFPETNTNGFNQCFGQAGQILSQIQGDDQIQQNFGPWMQGQGMPMSNLPPQFESTCSQYLNNANMPPSADMSATLNDGGQQYPFQGFAYCMVNLLSQEYGPQALSNIQDEVTVHAHDFRHTLLKRDNEFRARHGVPPFKRDKTLDDEAQEWADKMASECNLYHSDNSYAGRQWNGGSTGESIASGGTMGRQDEFSKMAAAYQASDMWYEEIKNYPFPQGYNGDGNDDTFEHIGHFTQTVWKDSKYVGYGYAYNPQCSGGAWYVAGRYSVPGNLIGSFQANVLPPQ